MYPQYYHTGQPPQDPNRENNPPNFMPYTPPDGLPQESKLMTYMNHTASTVANSLTHAMGNMSLESSSSMVNKVIVNEFVPVSYYTTPPPPIMKEPPESVPGPIAVVPPAPQVHQENVGGTTYFYDIDPARLNVPVPILSADPCLGATICPAVLAPTPYLQQIYAPAVEQIPVESGFTPTYYPTPEAVRDEMQARNNDLFLEPKENIYSETPKDCEAYSNLIPLKESHGIPISFRAFNRENSNCFALRRMGNVSTAITANLDKWKQFDHPNIVKLEEYFYTAAFNDHTLVLIYEYHPRSFTLQEKFLSDDFGNIAPDPNNVYPSPFSSNPEAPRPYTHKKRGTSRLKSLSEQKNSTGGDDALLPEAELWNIYIQLATALRQIHGAGLACTNLKPDDVIITGSRIRIAWGGATDVIIDPNDIVKAQESDITALGQVAMCMATRSFYVNNVTACFDLITKNYSEDLKNFIRYCITPVSTPRSVNELMPIIGSRFFNQIESLERRNDIVEEMLALEIDNGRLLRLLIKLGVINERPELDLDPTWSETGDRYMLKLFRDYLFHSVNEDGRPWLDQGHIAYCLNQLDGGTPTKVELMTRDEQSVLVVSYAELKHCLEQAYDELMQFST